jgi:hypothetical protein
MPFTELFEKKGDGFKASGYIGGRWVFIWDGYVHHAIGID